MPPLAGRIRVLRWLGGGRRVSVLGSALRAAEAAEQPEIAAAVLAEPDVRHAWPACLALAGAWDGLTPEQRKVTLALLQGRWKDVTEILASDPDARVRASLMTIAGSIPVIGAAGVVVSLLGDADAAVGDRAEWALGELVKTAGAPGTRNADRACVLRAVEASIEEFDRHRRTGVLRTAIRLAPWTGDGSGGGLPRGMAWMNDQQHPAQLVMRGLIRRGTEPELRACAWSWLKFDALAPACIERLAQPAGTAQHEAVLERWVLVMNPARARAIGRLKAGTGAGPASPGSTQGIGLLPGQGEANSLRASARAGLVRMIGVLPAESRAKDGAWAGRLCDPDASVRLMLARTAIEQRRKPACLTDLIFDGDARIAGLAANAVIATRASESAIGAEHKRLADVVQRSPHERLRTLGRQVRSGPGSTGRDARTADLVSVVEQYKRETGNQGLARRAASAVAALGGARSDDAVPILKDCLGLPDARVRANAVDAMVRHGRREAGLAPVASSVPAGAPVRGERDVIIELLLDHALDEHHRIRGSAARGLLTLGLLTSEPALTTAGQRSVNAMLADARPMHRVAGLWLVERLAPALNAPAEMIDVIAGISQRAEGDLERTRAERAAARLNVEVRASWSRRAPAIAPATEAAEVGQV